MIPYNATPIVFAENGALAKASDNDFAIPQFAELPGGAVTCPLPPSSCAAVTENAFTTATKAIMQQRDSLAPLDLDVDLDLEDWVDAAKSPPEQSSKRSSSTRTILLAAGSSHTFVALSHVKYKK